MVAFTPGSADLHTRFLAILPRIERHARINFRGIECQVKKEKPLPRR